MLDLDLIEKVADAATPGHASVANTIFLTTLNPALVKEWVAETKRLREALEFYAAKENWGSDDTSNVTGNNTFDVCLYDFDRDLEPKNDYAGRRARQALKGTDNGK